MDDGGGGGGHVLVDVMVHPACIMRSAILCMWAICVVVFGSCPPQMDETGYLYVDSRFLIEDGVVEPGVFRSCFFLRHVVIANTVKRIGNESFMNNFQLTTVTFEEPTSLLWIDARAFYQNPLLQSIRIPGTVQEIKTEAFSQCDLLNYVEVIGSPGNTSIGYRAFAESPRLRTIILSNGVTYITDDAFHFNAVDTLVIPDSVTYIGQLAFAASRRLRWVHVPEDVVVDPTAFPSCIGQGLEIAVQGNILSTNFSCISCAESNLVVPDGIAVLGISAFEQCRNVTSLVLPSSLREINTNAFLRLDNVVSITIPSTVQHIHAFAFTECTRLEEVHVSPSTNIHTDAFPNCLGYGLNLTNAFSEFPNLNLIRCIPCGDTRSLTIPDGVISIRENVFRNCDEIEEVIIPARLISIGRLAFSHCNRLRRVHIEPGLQIISDFAFHQCRQLRSISLPFSLVSLSSDAFRHGHCGHELIRIGAVLCNCEFRSCAPTPAPTQSPTTLVSPTGSPSPFVAVGPLNAQSEDSSATIVVIISCVMLTVAVVAIVFLVTRKQNRKAKVLRHQIENARNTLLGQSRDTFVKMFGHLLPESLDEFEASFKALQPRDGHPGLVGQREISQGPFGVVCKATYDKCFGTSVKPDVTSVAAKFSHIGDGMGNVRLLVEARVLHMMQHKSIIKLEAVFAATSRPWICTKFAKNGDLKTFLRTERRRQLDNGDENETDSVPEEKFNTIAARVCDALAYLTRIGVVHGDIAARNVLLGEDPWLDVYLSDFGAAVPAATASIMEDKYSANSTLPFRWMPPESLLESKMSSKSDVWAFGVLLWEMISFGRTPYGALGFHEVKNLIIEGERLPRQRSYVDLYQIATTCWNAAPEARPTFQTLLTKITDFGSIECSDRCHQADTTDKSDSINRLNSLQDQSQTVTYNPMFPSNGNNVGSLA